MTAQTGLAVSRDGSNNGTTPKGFRLATGGLLAKNSPTALDVRKGVLFDGAGTVVSGAAGMSYNVRACVAVVMPTTTQGPVVVSNDASVSVVTGAAPGANSRIDVIWIRQHLVAADGGADTDVIAEIGVTQGTVAASPAVPAIPSGALELARATVTSGTTATNTLTISQTHLWTVGAGAAIPVRSQAERDAIGQWDGLLVNRLDTDVLERSNGTAWTPLGGTADEGIWVDVPAISGAFTSSLQVRKVGKQVTMRGALQWSSSATSFTTGATVPVGYRPSALHPVQVGFPRVASTVIARGQVTTAGLVQLQMGSAFDAPMAMPTVWFVD